MEACEAVEKELQRVITKFSGVHEHSKRLLGDVTNNFEDLRSTLAEGNIRPLKKSTAWFYSFACPIKFCAGKTALLTWRVGLA